MPIRRPPQTSQLRQQQMTACLVLIGLLAFSGCGETMVYNRSIAELNAKAQQMIQTGNTAGAIARLESARDLVPDEPNTLYNLAVAYKLNQQYDQSIAAFEALAQTGKFPQADVYKSLGIAYEEKADQLLIELQAQAEKAGTDPAAGQKAADLQLHALASYEQSIAAYQKAAAGKADGQEIDAQIKALQAKIAEVKKGNALP